MSLLRIISKGCGLFFLFLHNFTIRPFMIPIFLCIVTGILIGYLLRKTSFVQYTGFLLSISVVLLLFFLGISVGINPQVVNNFVSIGLDAFFLTIGGTLGCLFCAKLIYQLYFKKRGE
jgi:hypothetical protein